jgi:hypothetical protein
MKSILLIILLICGMGLKTNESKSTQSVDSDYITIWKNLFLTLDRPINTCSTPDISKSIKNTLNIFFQRPAGLNPNLPYSKGINIFLNHGIGDSADMFDYLDDLFQKDITNYFNSVYKDAMNIPEADSNTYQDIYSIDKLLETFNNTVDVSNFQVEQKLDLLQKYLPIDKASFKSSISPARLYNIITQWGWNKPIIDDYARKLVDAYDISGDGRLNAYEFILMSIMLNKNFIPAKYSYNDIFKNKFDPIFYYLDCDSDGYVTGENIWYGFAKLKRNNPEKYNIYQCNIDANKNMMTASTNDFVLKNDDVLAGYVSLADFRTGLLLGYLNRQVKVNNVVSDDSINEKNARWKDGGTKQIVCEKLKLYSHK